MDFWSSMNYSSEYKSWKPFVRSILISSLLFVLSTLRYMLVRYKINSLGNFVES
jgi:hypothetical protein